MICRILNLILIIGAILTFGSCNESDTPEPTSAEGVLSEQNGTCANWSIWGTYTVGVPLDDSHAMSVEVDVLHTGDYELSTNTLNGYSFSASGKFTSTGIQKVTLKGSGTPEAWQTDEFTVTIGNAACAISVNVNPEKTENSQKRVILGVGERFSDSEYYLYALDENGKVLWTKKDFTRPQVVRNDTLFCNTHNTLYALNVFTGEQYWSRIYDSSIQGYLAIKGNRLYAAGSTGGIFAISIDDRNVIWNNPSDIYAVNSSSPTIANGVIYGGSPDKHLYAYHEDGALKWRSNLGAVIRSSPALSNDLVFVGADDGTLYALKQADGAIVWSKPVGIQGEESPTLHRDNVYIQGKEFIHCLAQATGDSLWTYEIPGGDGDWSSPTVVGDILYACGTYQGIHAFNAQTGEELWATSSSINTTDSPVVLDGIAYYASPGGMNANDAISGAKLWNYGFLDPWNASASVSFYTSPIVYNAEMKTTAYPSESGNKQ